MNKMSVVSFLAYLLFSITLPHHSYAGSAYSIYEANIYSQAGYTYTIQIFPAFMEYEVRLKVMGSVIDSASFPIDDYFGTFSGISNKQLFVISSHQTADKHAFVGKIYIRRIVGAPVSKVFIAELPVQNLR